MGRSGFALSPLAERLRELQRSRGVLHADETPVQQLAPGQGKTQRAYLWAYRSNDLEGDPPIVVFDYQTSRAGRHAASFLQGWQGHLLVDDYAGYKALFQEGTITELGCMTRATQILRSGASQWQPRCPPGLATQRPALSDRGARGRREHR